MNHQILSNQRVAILVVSAPDGVQEQTRRHTFLLNLLGIKKIIVVFNKMDQIAYDKTKFDRVKEELLKFLNLLDMKPAYCIPISAKTGDNISRLSSKIRWHNGPCFLNALDSLISSEKRGVRPLRFPVQDVYTVGGSKIILGRVEAGSMGQDQDVFFQGVVVGQIGLTRISRKHHLEHP